MSIRRVLNGYCPALLSVSLLVTPVVFAQCGDSPPFDAEDHAQIGANFGFSVAISADGTIALVGGPGFDGGDGVVRTFENVNGDWIEGVGFQAGVFVGEGIGSAIAMNDAGDLAVIGHPFDITPDPFVFLSGAASAWERDSMTGEWSRVHTFNDTDPVTRGGFGTAVALSPDGATAVISRASNLGSKTAPLPDSVFVSTRDGGGAWSPLMELIPGTAPGDEEQFGQHVAINQAGDVIAVGAPGNAFGPGMTGEIYLFRDIGGHWTHTETIASREPDESFSFFGSTFAFSGDTLLATDPADGLYSFDPDDSPDLFVYDGSDGVFGPEPDERIGVPLSLRSDGFGGAGAARGLGYGMAVRGDRMLLGASYESVPFAGTEAGSVYRLERGPDGWAFVSRLRADDPVEFSRFGSGLAISADGSEYLIGEPLYQPDFDLFGMGRVHFTGEAFREPSFRVQSASLISLLLSFPGVDPQVIETIPEGILRFIVPFTCGETDPVPQVQLVGGMMTVPEPLEITIAPGVTLTAKNITLSVTEASQPALLDQNGEAMLDGAEFRLEADIAFDGFPTIRAGKRMELGSIPVGVGGDEASGLTIDVPGFTLDRVIDAGLDDENPHVTADVTLITDETDPPCNPADLAEPFGLHDLADVVAFVTAFESQDGAADLAEPIGLFDLADVLGFVVLFSSGCP